MEDMEVAREGQRVFETARRLFSGRDGRIALTLVLSATAALEATLYTQSSRGQFPYDQGKDVALAVLVNVLAVLPLVVSSRVPVVAAGGSTFFTLVLLAAPDATVTASGLGVLLYTIGNVVSRRSLVWGIPFLVPFLIHAMAPFGGRTS